MEESLASVIMPAYNAADAIHSTTDSGDANKFTKLCAHNSSSRFHDTSRLERTINDQATAAAISETATKLSDDVSTHIPIKPISANSINAQ